MAEAKTILNYHGQKQTNEQCLTTTHARAKIIKTGPISMKQ